MNNQRVINLSAWHTAHKQGYIYFLQNVDTRNIKIGHALNVDRRIRDLQTGNEADLILLKKVPGSYSYETIVKRKFQAYRIKREWFELGLELQKFILWIDPEKSIQDQLDQSHVSTQPETKDEAKSLGSSNFSKPLPVLLHRLV